MKKYKGLVGLYEMAEMIRGKKGVGKSKDSSIIIKLKMHGDLNNSPRALSRLAVLLQFAPLFFESEVERIEASSEYEDSPDWNI